ncbi:MAG: hypothetical protein LBV33_05665, partial [Lachnospiraceae bacterium]|nr:hypothetical protein [Lachnospiraceae bacterium]
MNRIRNATKVTRRGIGLLMAVLVFAVSLLTIPAAGSGQVIAAPAAITSMAYFSPNDGPVFNGSGVGKASYGFVAPIFNDGANTWDEVVDDLQINVKVNGVWTDIDSLTQFVYNVNWGNWSDGGFNGYWFDLTQSTELQLVSRANPQVALEYTMNFTNLSTTNITAMTATQGPEIIAGVTGGAGFTYPSFNGDPAITYAQIADDLKMLIWSDDTSTWVDVDNNA